MLMRCDIIGCDERINAIDGYSSEFDLIFDKNQEGELTYNLCEKHYEEVKKIIMALEKGKLKYTINE